MRGGGPAAYDWGVATNVSPHRHADDAREFLLGMLVAFVVMVAVVLGTLYLLGRLGPGEAVADAPDYGSTPRVFTAEDLTPAPKPTAVWKFRADWQKPSQP
jgi:hypothetical protein